METYNFIEKGQLVSKVIPRLDKDIYKFSKDLGENIENSIS